MKVSTIFFSALAGVNIVNGFTTSPSFGIRSVAISSDSSSLSMAKGFGAKQEEPKKEKSAGQIKREQAANRYDELAATGGQEYNVFVRQFGGEDESWLPCGAIAVPRGAQVSDAIYSNESALKTAIVRAYPKLSGFEDEFEFGYNLKIYSDDPVEVAVKGTPKEEGFSVGNWLSLLFSPVDASGAQKPPAN